MREREAGAPRLHDYLYEYRGLWAEGASARVRIYEAEGEQPVVIATEPPDNSGSSVTNMIEYLAAEIVQQHFGDEYYEGRPPIFIEHYAPRQHGKVARDETFDLVEFSSALPQPVLVGGIWRVSLGEPTWTPTDKSAVEKLIGQTLD